MSYKHVDANRGITWLTAGLELLRRNPGVFAAIALVYALLQGMPVLGLAMIVLAPTLLGGFVYAMREQDQGRHAELGHLFVVFQQPGKIVSTLMLALPGVMAAVVTALLLLFALGGAIVGGVMGVHQVTPGLAVGLGIGTLLFGGIVLALALAVFALLVFAIPRVMFDDSEALAAMRESLSASIANLGALALVAGALFGTTLVAYGLFHAIPYGGAVLSCMVGSAFGVSVMYVAYKDVFGARDPMQSGS